MGKSITTENLGLANPGLTIRTGLASLTTLHTFALTCFSDMLLSVSCKLKVAHAHFVWCVKALQMVE